MSWASSRLQRSVTRKRCCSGASRSPLLASYPLLPLGDKPSKLPVAKTASYSLRGFGNTISCLQDLDQITNPFGPTASPPNGCRATETRTRGLVCGQDMMRPLIVPCTVRGVEAHCQSGSRTWEPCPGRNGGPERQPSTKARRYGA